MGMEALTLIANPGSASRKYALYHRATRLAQLHFEIVQHGIACNVAVLDGFEGQVPVDIPSIDEAAEQVLPLLKQYRVVERDEQISHVAIRIVAPGSYFLQHRVVDDALLAHLEAVAARAPLHVGAVLSEIHRIRFHFPHATIVGASDSAFHITKPDYAWNYGISLEDADAYDIKRFGYHGLSVASVVATLKARDKLVPKLVVCHLGGGASVSAVYNGKSIDTTMGYSPVEGLIMATRSGSIDPSAVRDLQKIKGLADDEIELYLNRQSGLLGLSGLSADIRELLEHEAAGNHRAKLALATYVHAVQKAIGQMTAALGGIDMLVFAGTVGERSAPMRERICVRLGYLDITLDARANKKLGDVHEPTCISKLAHSRPVYIVPTDESAEILRTTKHVTSQDE